MRKYFKKILLFLAIFQGLFIILLMIYLFSHSFYQLNNLISGVNTAKYLASPFIYNFNVPGNLQESGAMEESSSDYWWLNSGGILKIENGVGSTNQGVLPKLSRWYLLYRLNNPRDTDFGLYPQNIFRLVTRSRWRDFRQEVYFKIEADNLSQSLNRNASNGVLLFLRYHDGNNLYYAGVRVDGTAVIKKKQNGEYYTLAQEKIFDGEYDRSKTPNLLPKKEWVGLRVEIANNSADEVMIKLFLNKTGSQVWRQILDAADRESSLNKPILTDGFAGLRTDFMDVYFKDFKIERI